VPALLGGYGRGPRSRFTLSRWKALCRFVDDGRIELDNNPVERAIRPIALGRKNHLFAGSDGGAVRLKLGFELRPPVAERLERNPPSLAIFSLIPTHSDATPHAPERFVTRARHDLIRHLVLLTGKITGENRSRPQSEQTSVQEMDAYKISLFVDNFPVRRKNVP
jgi:Transposase IS66 family